MKIKTYVMNIIYFGAWFYINYKIYLAFSTGEFIGKRSNLISFEQTPIWFVIFLCIYMIISFTMLVFFVYSFYNMVNRKVHQNGGNYNLSTFKAIFRAWRKNITRHTDTKFKNLTMSLDFLLSKIFFKMYP